MGKNINHQLAINIALGQAYAGRVRRYGVIDAVKEYISLQTKRAFTTHHIREWISANHPELKVSPAALSVSLKRLLEGGKLEVIQKPVRGRYGVYRKKILSNFGENGVVRLGAEESGGEESGAEESSGEESDSGESE